MSLKKKFGIYLLYPPNTDLRAQGLGRHLAEFLKGAQSRGISFSIACPSWMRSDLSNLFDEHEIDPQNIQLLAPRSPPLVLQVFERLLKFRVAPQRPHLERKRGAGTLKVSTIGPTRLLEKITFSTRNPFVLSIIILGLLPLVILGLCATSLVHFARWIGTKAGVPLIKKLRLNIREIARSVLRRPQDSGWLFRFYQKMQSAEITYIHKLIDSTEDIAAWYCPTSYWPTFNDIQKPRLMCVPDVVLTDFPIAFSALGGDRLLDAFLDIETTISGGQYFVTYSEHVKRHTLVNYYGVNARQVSVIRHGANSLKELIMVSGYRNNDKATDRLALGFFRSALARAVYGPDATIYGNLSTKFIFYASQVRPNKNILNLIKAYEFLLRRRYFKHKLILTCDPHTLPEIWRYVDEAGLFHDVLFLKNISSQELAACYRLADLAVNPSLSEGGCPFTFTEALSVETPVVMAKIPVTTEVLQNESLQEQSLFDPYDWRDIAAKIEWGLNHTAELLELQKPYYEELSHRTWSVVVGEYLEILDRISE